VKSAELDSLRATSVEQLWDHDLDALSRELDCMDAHAACEAVPATAGCGRGRGKARKKSTQPPVVAQRAANTGGATGDAALLRAAVLDSDAASGKMDGLANQCCVGGGGDGGCGGGSGRGGGVTSSPVTDALSTKTVGLSAAARDVELTRASGCTDSVRRQAKWAKQCLHPRQPLEHTTAVERCEVRDEVVVIRGDSVADLEVLRASTEPPTVAELNDPTALKAHEEHDAQSLSAEEKSSKTSLPNPQGLRRFQSVLEALEPLTEGSELPHLHREPRSGHIAIRPDEVKRDAQPIAPAKHNILDCNSRPPGKVFVAAQWPHQRNSVASGSTRTRDPPDGCLQANAEMSLLPSCKRPRRCPMTDDEVELIG